MYFLLLSALLLQTPVRSDVSPSADDTDIAPTTDPNGYILFCPCMGRFGNQADQFLGVLSFAKQLDRTLILPHWVEYHVSGFATSLQIPFDKYFLVEPLLRYHRVILMKDFMTDIAPLVWPTNNRTIFCYQPRPMSSGEVSNGCNAKYGNPFGPYWDHFDIDFTADEFHKPLLWSDGDIKSWKIRYTGDKWPVLAFTGAPAKFPVSESNANLQEYLQWSDLISSRATQVITTRLTRPYIGAHLRIGSDWKSACRHVKPGERHHLFSSPQCLGYKFQHGTLTEEMCLPSSDTIISQLIHLINKYKAKSVYLARDDPSYDALITEQLDKISVSHYWLDESDPHTDLAVLAQADHYVSGCVSSFASFAVRERRAVGRSVSFWAFDPQNRDEL